LTQSRPTGPDRNKEGWADQQISAARHIQQDQNSKRKIIQPVGPRIEAKEARSPIVVLKSDVPAAVFLTDLIVWR
jgi:hypothetical protein